MMSGMPLETCWAFNKRWNNKFYYKVASSLLFLLIHTTIHGSMNIKFDLKYLLCQTRWTFVTCRTVKISLVWFVCCFLVQITGYATGLRGVGLYVVCPFRLERGQNFVAGSSQTHFEVQTDEIKNSAVEHTIDGQRRGIYTGCEAREECVW
jgi:hypothetical protein